MAFKKSVLLILVFGFALLSTGCGREISKKDEITMWLVGSEGQAKTVMRLGEEFTKKTGIKFDPKTQPFIESHVVPGFLLLGPPTV